MVKILIGFGLGAAVAYLAMSVRYAGLEQEYQRLGAEYATHMLYECKQ